MKRNPLTKLTSIALLAACVAVVLSLTACSSGESEEPEEQVPEEPEYTVQLYIDCEQNLIFSRYDVDVMVDGDEVGNVEHGSDATFELSLAKGQHEMKLEKEGDSEPDGKTTFVVEAEGDKFSYRIKCTSDQIEIKSTKGDDEEKADSEAEEGSEKQEAEAEPVKVEEPEEQEPAPKEEPEEQDAAPKEDPKPSKYEYAYVRRMSNYDLYYLIDLDDMTATYFGTNDSGSMTMPCSGDLESGLTIDYADDGFQEHLQFKKSGDDSVAILTDASGFDWEYEKTDVAGAEDVLASVS